MNAEKPLLESRLERIDTVLSSGRRWTIMLFVGSLLLKLAYVIQSADATHVTVPIMDSEYYYRMAEDIMSGGFVRGEAYFMGPLYPYVLAILFGIFGKSIMAVRIVQAVVGSLTVVLTWMIGRRIMRPSVAFLAAAMLALYGAMTFYEGQLLMMWLGTVLNMSMLWVLMTRKGTGSLLLAGVLLGLSALARANVLIVLVVVVPWILFLNDRAKRWRNTILFTGAVVITILPATIHNLVTSHDFVLITSNGGVNFYIGNSPGAAGIFYPPKGINLVTDDAVKTYVERVLGHKVTPSELSRYWFGEAFDFIRSSPGAELGLTVRKAALYLNGYEIPQIEAWEVVRSRYGSLRILFVSMWMLLSLGLMGMLFAVREWKRYFLLYGYFIAFSASIVLFFVTARYRIQVAPVLALFAAYALVIVLPRAIVKVRRQIAPIVLFVVIVLATNPKIFALPKDEVMWREYTHEARRLSKIGQHEAALAEINKAIELHPDYADSYVSRALIHKEAGQRFQAIDDYAKAIDINPDIPTVQYDFGQLLRQLKMYEPAAAAYEAAIRLSPTMLEAYNNLGITYQLEGRHDEASRYFRKVIDMDPAYIKAYNNLGASLAQSGKLDEAIDVLNHGVGVDPTYPNTYKNLAMVYIQKKDVERAHEMLNRYVQLDPNDARSRAVLDQLQSVIEGDTLGLEEPDE